MAKAQIAELELAEEAGSLVRRAEVEAAIFSLARQAMDAMDAIADRLATQLAAEADPNRVHALLSEEIHRIAQALARARPAPVLLAPATANADQEAMSHAMPIIPWPGGKRRLADLILPFFGNLHRCYVEPFAGGAAMFFYKSPSDVEVINDINGELINLYRVVQHHLEKFVRQFQWALSSRQVFAWLQITRPETLTDIQRAARFYYLQQLTFGGKVEGQSFGYATQSPPGLNRLRLEESLSAAHLRLANVYIENLPWAECIARYDRDHTLFFLDPPYWQTESYGVDFGWEQYQALAATLRGIKGRAYSRSTITPTSCNCSPTSPWSG